MSAQTKWLWWRMPLALWCGLALVANARAADVELSDDFLEYLGGLEDEHDNWTDLESAESQLHAASSSASSTASSATQRSNEISRSNERISGPDTQRNVVLPAAKAVK